MSESITDGFVVATEEPRNKFLRLKYASDLKSLKPSFGEYETYIPIFISSILFISNISIYWKL